MPGSSAPAFSPNGSALAWIKVRYGSSGRTGMDIVVAEADGRHPQTIASLPLGNFISDLSLAWSPDGRRLAFSYPETPTSAHVFVVDHDGARLTQITSNPVAMRPQRLLVLPAAAVAAPAGSSSGAALKVAPLEA